MMLDWLGETSLSLWLQTSSWGFQAVETVHVIAIALVFGTIATVDLRLVGVASKSSAITAVMKDALPWTWGAFVMAAISGVLMILSAPTTYYYNGPFRIKLILLLLAGINMLVFETIVVRDIQRWDRQPRTPIAARCCGGLSLIFWISIVGLGRWIGFTKLPF